MNYQIRLYTRDNIQEYERLFAQQVPVIDAETLKRRLWWCFENPFGGAFAVATLDDLVVSTSYLAGRLVSVNGVERKVFEIGESATHHEHQRRGLFSRVASSLVKYAREQGSPLVYGTPNAQAEPGWRKLGFEIVQPPANELFVLPNLRYWATRSFSGRAPGNNHGGYETNGQSYIFDTKGFERICSANDTYLKWRFLDSPHGYRFFRYVDAGGVFRCAVRMGKLGSYPVVVVAEHYLNGKKQKLEQVARMLRKTVASGFSSSSYMGIYLLAGSGPRVGRVLRFPGLAVFHRNLPACSAALTDERVPNLVDDIFQLSDCDIG